MPLSPTIKTWDPVFHYSNPLSGVEKTDYDAIFIALKNALKSGTTACTVAGSCDGTTASMTGVDRITNSASIVHAAPTVAHSWIVLNLVGMGASQVKFDFNNGNIHQFGIYFSPGGLYTGGSTTAGPTATDEQTLLSSGGLWAAFFSGGSGGQLRAHMVRTSDGANTRIYICGASQVLGAWKFEKVYNAVGGWTLPYVACALGINTNVGNDATLMNQTNWVGVLRYLGQGPVGQMSCYSTFEGFGGTWAGSRLSLPNEISGEYPLCPIGLWHDTTVGQRGRHGIIPDLYYTGAGSAMGDTFPADGTKQWVQMGATEVVPNDGSTWLIN